LCENTEIKISAFGYHAELIGAAVLVMQHYENELSKSTGGVAAAETSFDLSKPGLLSVSNR
jgi:hypothetical protein